MTPILWSSLITRFHKHIYQVKHDLCQISEHRRMILLAYYLSTCTRWYVQEFTLRWLWSRAISGKIRFRACYQGDIQSSVPHPRYRWHYRTNIGHRCCKFKGRRETIVRRLNKRTPVYDKWPKQKIRLSFVVKSNSRLYHPLFTAWLNMWFCLTRDFSDSPLPSHPYKNYVINEIRRIYRF